jgi:hypothetical protein
VTLDIPRHDGFLAPEELVAFYEAGGKINPMKSLEGCPAQIGNITHDPLLVRGDFFMCRRHWTDGTLALTYMMIGEMLDRLARRECYAINCPPDPEKTVIDIFYTIGQVSVFGKLDEERRDFSNWFELFTLPLKCEYRYAASP